MYDYQIVIAGAGVVGLAIAMELSRSGYSVLVIERNPSFGQETSSRNSEVIHSGIYYEKNSLKARLCVEGNNLLYDWCINNDVPHKKIGKYIVALSKDEEERLTALYNKGLQNGVKGLRFASIDELIEYNSGIYCTKAIFSENTGIVDTHKLMESFIYVAIENKCEFAYNHSVKSVKKENNILKILVSDIDENAFEISSQYFINSAGLAADILAENSGIDIDKNNLRLNYCKGHYFKISSRLNNIAKNLIYPVPPVQYVGLGIHLTIDLAGNLKLGPDTVYTKSRELDYSIPEDLAQKFYQAAKRYIPQLTLQDISPDQSGIRPKLQRENEVFRDFVIQDEKANGLENFINLIGIESPGLSSSLAIAKYIKENFIK